MSFEIFDQLYASFLFLDQSLGPQILHTYFILLHYISPATVLYFPIFQQKTLIIELASWIK